MATSAARRSVMTLFSVPECPESHRVRIVLAEKELSAELIDVDPDNKPEDLLDLNPYGSVPTLVDRDLALYSPAVMMEYLDERFPHPPLMPVDPVARARTRQTLERIERDWYGLLDPAGTGVADGARGRKRLGESIASISEVFAHMPFFLNEEFTLLDATIAPILWRLPHWGVELPGQPAAVQAYAERIFERPTFRASLSRAEREMRD